MRISKVKGHAEEAMVLHGRVREDDRIGNNAADETADFGRRRAVLSLLDGPSGCDPCFCVVWFRFRLLRRYLALWSAEVGRIYRVLGMVGEGCPGHGPLHLLSSSAAEIGFFLDPGVLAWVRPSSS